MQDLQNHPYTEQVFSESSRLFPPVWGIFRDCKSADEIGGYRITPGSVVLLSSWLVQHDARFFYRSGGFPPGALGQTGGRTCSPLRVFPLWGRPVLCIGNIFAMVEARLLFATIAQKWGFKLAPDNPFEPVPSLTNRPRYGIKVVAYRHDA
jgi:cytochrome P450